VLSSFVSRHGQKPLFRTGGSRRQQCARPPPYDRSMKRTPPFRFSKNRKHANLDTLLRFVEFTQKFQQVLRTNRAPGGDRRENDAEHSFQVALVAWYVNDALRLRIDTGQILAFGIAHDLVEAYAGDTDPHLHKLTPPKTKVAREAAAVEALRNDFQEFGDLAEVIETYEASKGQGGAAQLVYAVDKLLVFANMYLTVDPYYNTLEQTRGISMVADMEKTRPKVRKCAPVDRYFAGLLRRLKDASAHRKPPRK
jgi:5'-deoxynucleotidase YfbR-like HD superfamily hydrolase